MYFTQEQLQALNQSIRQKRIRIEILNYNLKIIDTIEGEAVDGSINIDATSDYRRSCNLVMVVDSLYTGIVETKYLVDKGNIIWLDKYIKLYVGIDDVYTEDTVWYNMGIYIIDEPSYSYSITESTLKMNGMDLMFNLSDKRRGQLTDYQTKIIVYDEQTGILIKRVSIRETFINILNTYTNINKYYLAPMTGDLEYLPENLIFEAGITVYDMLSKVLSYLPEWEMFFDIDGIFTVQPIPDGVNDTVYPLDINNTSAEEISVDFSNVKNLVVVRGRTHDCDYFLNTDNGDTIEYDGNTLKINLSGIDNLSNNIKLGFVSPDNQYNPELNQFELNGTVYNLYDFEGITNYIPANTFQPGSINIIRYRNINTSDTTEVYWDYLSNDQANAFAVNDIIDNPFYINAELKGENYYGGLTYCADHTNYQVTLNNERTLSNINDGVQITLMPNTWNNTNPTLTILDGINSNILLSQTPIVNKNGGSLSESQWFGDNTIYILKYNMGDNVFILQGRLQTFTSYLSGGEYENIYSNSLAKQRADYELYLHSNLNDQISINTIPNYYMDVNRKILYKDFVSSETTYYLTKNISLPLATTGATMNISAMKLYPPKYYITTETTGCMLEITDEYGNKYSNGDIIRTGTKIVIDATALEYYTNEFEITINGNIYNIGDIYTTSENVTIIAEAGKLRSIITVNNTRDTSLGVRICFHKYDTEETNIYINDVLRYTTSNSGDGIYDVNLTSGISTIAIDGGEFSYGQNNLIRYCLGSEEYNSYITNVTFGYNYSNIIGENCFSGASNLENVYIPSKIESIGKNAFRNCYKLSNLTYNSINCTDNVYGDNVFSGVGRDVNLVVNIGNKVNRLPDYLFTGIYARNLIFEEGVQNIGRDTFNSCARLTTLILPKTLNFMGIQCFYNCSGLQSITMLSFTPPIANSNTFFNNTNNCPIYVPVGSVETYKTAQYWSSYADRIQVKE